MKTLLYILILNCFFVHLSWGQNKTDNPSTHNELCFLTIKKVEFDNFKKVKKAIDREDYGIVYAAIRKMKQSLKGFTTASHNRAFEMWYVGNYTDFDKQANVAKESTIAALKNYESRLRTRDALYYEHRLFLDQYLAFETEAFYPDYWFMSQERYFSKEAVERVEKMNKEEGEKIFMHSDFFQPFNYFNKMASQEDLEIQDYLDVEKMINDTTSFIPYSYMYLDKNAASYILQTFNLDDATQDVDVDREIAALKNFLKKAKEERIYLVARFNHIEIKKLKALEKAKKKKD